MSHSWEEVQELLEDEFVAGDTKEHLLHAYIRENYGFIGDHVPPEVQEYVEDYSLEGGDDEGSLDEVYERAQNQSEDHGYQERQAQEELDGNTSELTDMRPPEATGSGVEKSDEIFELARPALGLFETWLPINDQVPDGLVGGHGRPTVEDIQTRFDEQVGIDFRKFLEDAERMRQAHAVLGELNTTTQQQLNSVYQSWTGPAANASYDHYSQQIAPKTSSLLEALPAGADLIGATVENVFQACRTKAEEIMGLYTPTVGEAPRYIARWMVQLARGEEISQAEAKSVASWIDRQVGGGSALENSINNDMWQVLVLEELRNFSREWIRDCFNRDLHDRILEDFERVCDETRDEINTAYEELNAVLGEYENEFSDASALQVTGPGAGTTTGGGGGGDVPAGAAGSGVPGLGGGGSTAGGGGSGAGGGGGAPQMPPAVDIPSPSTIPSLAGAGSGTADPAGSGPGMGGPPGTGDLAGTQPAGQGQPAVPGPDGLLPPVPTQPDAGQPETVTIEDGDRTISVSSPDGQGRVTVTIDDGNGQPKTYELDFGEGTGTGSAGAVPREPGAVPLPAQVPGDAGPGAPPVAGPVPDLPPPPLAGPVPDMPPPQDLPGPRWGGPGPPPDVGPMPDLPPQPTAAASVLAGPDGVARIEDGDMSITAERPSGSPDRVMVTIDDGSGDPTTYTVDYSDPANPTSTVASGSAASGFGGAPGFGGQAGSFGLPDQGQYTATVSPAGGSGEAALASASDSADSAGRGQGAHGGAGMPMMGGMGAAAQGGGDQERTASPWRTSGDLFDDDQSDVRVRGAVGDNR